MGRSRGSLPPCTAVRVQLGDSSSSSSRPPAAARLLLLSAPASTRRRGCRRSGRPRRAAWRSRQWRGTSPAPPPPAPPWQLASCCRRRSWQSPASPPRSRAACRVRGRRRRCAAPQLAVRLRGWSAPALAEPPGRRPAGPAAGCTARHCPVLGLPPGSACLQTQTALTARTLRGVGVCTAANMGVWEGRERVFVVLWQAALSWREGLADRGRGAARRRTERRWGIADSLLKRPKIDLGCPAVSPHPKGMQAGGAHSTLPKS